jgi:hypothetical protein
MPDDGARQTTAGARFAAKSGKFEPIDKVLTPSYLSGRTSQARPAGVFMLAAAKA